MISTAAASFLRNGIEVVGILHGYSNLVEVRPRDGRCSEGRRLHHASTTSMLAPDPQQPRHPDRHRPDQPRQARLTARPTSTTRRRPARSAPSTRRWRRSSVDALISIGGDDTLKTANKFKLFQERLPAGLAGGSRSSTCPRRSTTTTAASTSRSATSPPSRPWPARSATCWPTPRRASSYFLVETMGRSAGWLAYGVAIAGEASLVISVEDITASTATTEEYDRPDDGRDGHARRS